MCNPKLAKENVTHQAMSLKTSLLPTILTSLRHAPGVSHTMHQNMPSQGLQDHRRGTYCGRESVKKGEDGGREARRMFCQ